jgi:hypothetical protein
VASTHGKGRLEIIHMRATRTAVVLSSVLIAGSTVALAGTDKDKKAPPPPAAPAPAAPPAGSNTPQPQVDPATVKPEDMPTAVRMRRLEQKTQALKERAWQLKARVQMLKEQMLGGGVGAQALISHANEMGSSFRLVKLTYAVDGTEVFLRKDENADSLYKSKSFDIFSGPISPGSHNISAMATYRGNGYGVFEYLSKFTFTATGTNAFTAGEGKISKVDCKGYEKGGQSTPMEKRPAIDCVVTQVSPDKAPEAPKPTAPGTTPLPAATPTPATSSTTTTPGK